MKKLCFFQFILFFSLTAVGQIPVREYLPNIVKLDTQFHRQARDSGFSLFINQWIQEADMNNDGKLDLVLQPYDHQTRRDGIISIFYNQSTSTNSLFKNLTRDNFYTLGDVAQFTVGDINGDGRMDLLAPTQNYHGSFPPPPYLYPNGGDNTPDKLWVKRDTGYQRYVFPDNFNTESGNLYRLRSVNKEILITNYTQPVHIPPHTDPNILYRYNFNVDSTQLIRSTTFNGIRSGAAQGPNRDYLLRIGGIRSFQSEDTTYNYFSIEKGRSVGNGLDSILVLSYRKADSLDINTPFDTIAQIKYIPRYSFGYEYIYRTANEWGTYVVDLNGDGQKEVVTHEWSYFNGPSNIDTQPPSSRIQIYNKNGNITSSWIDAEVEYDPQYVGHGIGISVVDINGDGLPDILPRTGWGWIGGVYQGFEILEPEQYRKRVLLNTGTRFKSFIIDFSNFSNIYLSELNSFIRAEFGTGTVYPFPLDEGSTERSIIMVRGRMVGGGSFGIPSWDTLSAVPALKLDFSQFKFPCSAFPPSFSLTADTLLCNLPDSALLQIDSVKGYQTRWYKNGTLLSTKHFFLARDTGSYNLVITNLGGCEASRIIRVRVAATPNPSFSINSSSQCLTGNSFSFTNSSTIAGGTLTHSWNFGDGGTATTLNAIRTYASAGTYTVKLVSTSNNSCKDSTTQQVVVNPIPVSSYSINTASQCLTGNSFSFTNSSAIASGTLTHLWSFGDGGTATTLNATRSYTAPGTYSVKLVSSSNYGCKDSTTQQVVVNPIPASSYSINTAAQCLTGNNFSFTNNSAISSGTLTHFWSFGDGGTATTLNATRSYVAPGTYPVKLVSTSNNGCKDSTTQQVVVNPMPASSYSINTTAQCLTDNSFTFTNSSTIASGTLTSHFWNFGDGGTATTLNATRSYVAPGTYPVRLVSTSNNGCKDSTTRQVTVHPMPVSGFTVSPAIQCLTGNSFSFYNTSTVSGGTTTSNWNFGNGSMSTSQSPTFTYPMVGAYTVKLVSTSNNGCRDSTTRSVRIDVSPTATLNVAPYRSIHPGLLTTINASIAPAGTYKYAWYRNNQLISNETTTAVDSIGYRLWSGVYKMAIENLPPQLPCSYTTPELIIGDSVSSKLFIYPNPNNGQFRVTYYSPTNTRYQVVVMDTKGSVLYRKLHEVSNRYQLIDINLTGTSRGLYILQIQDPTGKQLASGQLVIH